MLKIKDDIDMQELENIGFEPNEFIPKYTYEVRSKKRNLVVIEVDENTKEVCGYVCDCYNTPLPESQIKHHCPELFANDMVEKDGE